jgi:anti-sigma28 factor (negative regulator of flagellin synthesis)
MSMRIGNPGEGSFVESARSSAMKATNLESRNASESGAVSGADKVNLSNASSLIALAKGSTPSDRATKIASLSAQVSSGTYRADASEVGKALINGYTKAQ